MCAAFRNRYGVRAPVLPREDARMKGARAKKTARAWENLERHFTRHQSLVHRFRAADAVAVLTMW